MNNIAEGFASGSASTFRQFLGYARRSASEVQCCLYIALDLGYTTQLEFDHMYEQTEKTRRMVTSFMKYLGAFKRPNKRVLEPVNA